MLAKRIIPCLDVKDGRVVKGINFVGLKDAGDPVELARAYDQQGADELVFLDITASSDKRYIIRDLVEKTAKVLFIPFTVGGGINDIPTIRDLLGSGADKVSLNTSAVKSPDLIETSSRQFGAQAIVVAIDAKAIKSPSGVVCPIPEVALDSASRWEVFVNGGRTPMGIDAIKWAAYVQYRGAGELLVTSMDKDGTKSGYDIDLMRAIRKVTTIPIIASGGAGQLSHISDILAVSDAALLASLLHFGDLTVSQIKEDCLAQSLPIRSVK
jgi:imidazole glycerol-phosphate synthase subunit HisF